MFLVFSFDYNDRLEELFKNVHMRSVAITEILQFSSVQQPCTRITMPKLANNFKSTTVSMWNFVVMRLIELLHMFRHFALLLENVFTLAIGELF
ncbi:hypothetical protein T4D_7239 [Trichinella pseudospiralis]|uniref:Uncharacterized protein n=1 Tax=Trichinella pseudospiralis TaxID=6337 RepID=A0A0V1FQ74_TRIPS|nr:hypothetical protein T4D_7239 [Trichinella pseudospiralis]